MEKIVSQLDEKGYFVCAVVADESPLEPGVFLIPGGAVDIAPPNEIEPGKMYRISGEGWMSEDIPAPEPEPEPEPLTPEQVRAGKVWIVQSHMDSAARDFGYDSIANAITYAEEPAVPKFQAEGQAFRAWRSLVWERCYEILAEVESGGRGVPSDDELIAELPELQLPTS